MGNERIIKTWNRNGGSATGRFVICAGANFIRALRRRQFQGDALAPTSPCRLGLLSWWEKCLRRAPIERWLSWLSPRRWRVWRLGVVDQLGGIVPVGNVSEGDALAPTSSCRPGLLSLGENEEAL